MERKMSRRSILPSSRRHVNIFDEDWNYLERTFGMYSYPNISAGVIIRLIVHDAVKEIKEREAELLQSLRVRSEAMI
jgi:hypothetical protein